MVHEIHSTWLYMNVIGHTTHDTRFTTHDTRHTAHDTRESFTCYTRVIRMLKERHFFSVHSLLAHSVSVHSLLTPYSLISYSLTHHTCTCVVRARKQHRCRAVRKSKLATFNKDSLVTPVVIN
jgi:hypothetical protein